MFRIIVIFLFIGIFISCNNNKSVETEFVAKKLRIPEKVWKVPDSNDYENPESQYSFSRHRESENFGIFWDKNYGKDPLQNEEELKRFNVDSLVSEGERFFNYYVDDLKFLEKGKSTTDSTKILMYIFGGDDATAYGAGKDSVGMLWSPAVRVSKQPYGALAHELGHSFQYLVHADGYFGFSGGGSIWEMTSQWMLWQVYPSWIEFENYHLKGYLDKTYLAFLHENNMYHSPFVLEYWSEKHGIDFIGKLWRQSKKGEDPVMVYKRLTEVDQESFNNEIFDASRRFVTWDLKRIEEVSKSYANMHHTDLDEIEDGWYRITKKQAPQNYGYNAIELVVPESGAVELEFKGITNSNIFNIKHVDKAGWRYGFVAVKEDGSRVYGNMYNKPENKIKFSIPEETAYLWLVVSGAPKKHHVHKADGDPANDEQWPYKFRLENTKIKN